MQVARLTTFVLAAGLITGCGDDLDPPNFPTTDCSAVTSAHCVEIRGEDSAALQAATNSIDANTTLVLGVGTFKLDNQLTIRTAGAHVIGQGIDLTTLDFGPTTTQVNGVDVVGDDFLIQDLTVLDAPKDGIRVEASKGVVYRRIRATWSTESSASNGAYGIYPVKSQNVLVEESFAENASDAGLYVGQCQNVIVRNNTVTKNVAGLEIENTQYAEVYGNTAEDNTGGIVVFDLPGNPIVGRDVRIHNNVIRNNNRANFATPGTTVSTIPAGTGTFAMASRRVVIDNNTYQNNNTGDIALISGLVVDDVAAHWALDATKLTGTYEDLNLMSDPSTPGIVLNFRSENIVVKGNTHAGSGTKPDLGSMLGPLLALSNVGHPIDSVLYDAIMELRFHSTDPALNTNINHMCIGGNTGGTFASMDLEHQSATSLIPFFRPPAPFKPYDCLELDGDPIVPVVLP